jgi:glucose dehydrogenase
LALNNNRQPAPLSASDSAVHASWSHFAGDAGATQYSSLSAITRSNVRQLQVAWQVRTGEHARYPNWIQSSAFANTPLLVGDSLIACTPSNRVMALDPTTGRERWFFDPDITIKIGRGSRYVCRGVAQWTDPLAADSALCKVPLQFAFGTPNRGGPMLTGGGLVFIGATMDDAFRVFDTMTGEELWRTQLPAGGQATPMTYLANGRQYVLIAAGGHDTMATTRGDYLVAYALPPVDKL